MIPRFVICCRLVVLNLCVFGSPASATEAPSPRMERPLRHLELVTGERLNVEFLSLDGQGCEFRWHGLTRCRLPLAAIRSLANPAGIIDHWDEALIEPQSGRRGWHSRRDLMWHRTVESPVAVGELTMWIEPTAAEEQRTAAQLCCRFQQGDAIRELLLLIRGDGSIECDCPRDWQRQFSQRLRPPQMRARLSVRWNADRCEVMIDDALHSTYKTDAASFTGLILKPGNDDSSAIVIDEVVLRQFDAEMAARSLSPRVTEVQDAITLTTGDQFFGHFTDAKSSGDIALRGPLGDWSEDWRKIIRLDFARRPLPAHLSSPVRGWCADVRLSSERVTTGIAETLRGVRFTPNSLLHPWLGEMAWSLHSHVSISPYGRGEFRWLAPDRRHLGDEIRTDLTPTRPDGTAIAGTLHFDERPAGTAWIVVDVAELEPSGPHTLPTQPFLETLRGGGLRTELVINDHVITDLNRLISLRTLASQPDRLWLPVPSAAWRAGKNSWAIRQRPLSTTQAQYDDCEVGRVGLWVGHQRGF